MPYAYRPGLLRGLQQESGQSDDFRKNQKEVQELLKRVQDVKARLEGNHNGIKDLYYEKVGRGDAA